MAAAIRRFWDEVAAQDTGQGSFRVELDGKPVRTPMASVLTLPVPRYADAVAEEWRYAGNAKGELVAVDQLPLTRIACSAQDRVATNREGHLEALLRVGATDLLCYRAGHPTALVERQTMIWQPLLDWVALTFDAPLAVTQGLMPIVQDPRAIAALRLALQDETALRLAAIGVAVEASGSLVIALAMAHGRIDATEAELAASLDDRFSLETWGDDAEAADRLERIAADLRGAARALALANG